MMFKFVPILKSVIWGGDRIISYKSVETDLQHVGESWEISSIEGSLSVVSEGSDEGMTIVELLDKYRDRLVGRENYARHGNCFPLLIKFIDARCDLSIQVHPNDVLAFQRHGKCGKSEMWYVIDALPDARLCSGFSTSLTPSDYECMIANGSITSVLHYDNVHAGDVFYLPAGRIHSLGAGCFIVEVQQTCDITYRVFDYNRSDKDGKMRELHTELAKDALDYSVLDNYKTNYNIVVNEPSLLVDSPHFVVSLYALSEPMECDYSALDSFVIYICIEGSAVLTDGTGYTSQLSTGETILLPAKNDVVHVVPDGWVKFLEVFL